MRSRLSSGALLARHLRANLGASLLVALLVGLAVFAVAAAPRALAGLATDELRSELASQSPLLRDLTGSGHLGMVAGIPDAKLDVLVGSSDEAIQKLPGKLPYPLHEGAGEAQWVARTTTSDGYLPNLPSHDLAFKLAFDLHWADRVRIVDGEAPIRWEASEDDPPGTPQPPIEIALSVEAAERMRVQVGDLIGFAPEDLRVAALYEPVDPDDDSWAHLSDLATATLEQEPGVRPKIRASGFIHPETLIGLQNAFTIGELRAWIPIDAEAYEYADLPDLVTQVREATATQVSLPNFGDLDMRSGIPDVLERVAARVSATSAMLALCYSGLFGVVLAAFALGMQIVIRRRRTALALAAARGAGELQLRGSMLLEAALISLPGSAVAITLAQVAFPGAAGPEAWVLPVLVALAPLVLAVALTTPRARHEPRDDLQVRSTSRARWVVEVAVVALGAVALFLLWRRGLVETSAAVGIDPLLAATPLLLATAVCALALRLYPLPMRAVAAATRRRGSPTGVLGAARAVRDPALGFAAAFASVVGVAVIVFSAVTATTIQDGLLTGARDQIGADVQIRAQDQSPAVVDAVTRVDGVTAAVAVSVTTGVVFEDTQPNNEVTVVTADTEVLHAVRPDIPVLTPRADGRVPVLVSSDWVERIRGTDLTIGEASAVSEGVIVNTSLPGVSRRWVLMDASAATGAALEGTEAFSILVDLAPTAPEGTLAEIDDVVSAAQSEATRGSVQVLDARTRLAEALESPTVAGLQNALVLAAGTATLLTLLTVTLASVAATGARNRLVGVLRILGMSPRQIRALLAWELGPVAVMSLVVGTALGLALPLLLTTVIDLRSFVGGIRQPGPVIDPLWVGAGIGAFLAAVVLAGLLAAALSRRFAPASTLKMGDA